MTRPATNGRLLRAVKSALFPGWAAASCQFTVEEIPQLQLTARLLLVNPSIAPDFGQAGIVLSGNDSLISIITESIQSGNPAAHTALRTMDLGNRDRSIGIPDPKILVTVLDMALLPVVTGVIANLLTNWRRKSRATPPQLSITFEFKKGSRFFRVTSDGSPRSIRELKRLARSEDFDRWLK